MKPTLSLGLPLALVAILAAGCHPQNMATIKGYPKEAALTGADTTSPDFNSNTQLKDQPFGESSKDGIPLADPTERASWARDHNTFKKDTVYFDFDSSSLKSAEKAKVAKVADYLKSNPGNGLEIDGHCDERGTEEYNRSLGERRALALREELAKLGVNPAMIDTVSFGKDKPAMSGHDETAFRKNRRGEFVLEIAPGKTQ